MNRTISQTFTRLGWVGMTLLFCGPLVSAIGYLEIYRSERLLMLSGSSSLNLAPFIALALLGTFATLAALPMMLIGRSFQIDRDVTAPD